MRVFLYDHLISDPALQARFGGVEEIKTRVMPRQSQENINVPRPFLVYGLGNSTNEDLADEADHEAHRQFFQVWVHDEGGDYGLIDDIIPEVKRRLIGASHPPSNLLTIRWLETSQEFTNQTYNTLFRYIRFQGIIAKGAAA